MAKVPANSDYIRVHRETFKVWQKLDLEKVSLSTLRMMERRLTATINEMHQQVHKIREELGLSARNWPVKTYLNPGQAKSRRKRGTVKRKRKPTPYIPSDDPAKHKRKIKATISWYSSFRERVRKAIREKETKHENPTAHLPNQLSP